jgi:hypothetical protein
MIEGTRKAKVRKSKTFAKGRVCANKDCEQVLSQYNKQKFCFQHHEKKFPRVRGHELVK